MKKVKKEIFEFLFWFCFFIIFITAGCDIPWNAANRKTLEKDFSALVGNCGVEITEVKCHMLGSTRDAVCVFKATREQIDDIKKGLKLKAVVAGSEEQRFAEQIEDSSSHKSFQEFKSSSGQSLERYFSKRRAKELILKKGTSFEYFLLYYDPSSGRACVLLSYAYG